MPRNNRQPAKYDIQATTYTYCTDGVADKNGRVKWDKCGAPKKSTKKNTNFNELKQNLYAKGKSAGFVNYDNPKYTIRKVKPHIRSVVKVDKNKGTKTVTYYNAVKK